ncbi:membrane protein, partial [Streptomyces varsoviensis]
LPVVLLQAVTAAGWFRLNGMWPARQGIALAFLAGVVADIGLLATDADQAPTVLIGAVGVWILLVVVLQLRSRSTPDERLYGLTAAA